MHIELEPTSQLVTINGLVEGRIWQGRTDTGIAVQAVITRIAVPSDDKNECERFARELRETPAPKLDVSAFYPRFTL
jgi:hypothetical protein